MARDGTATRTRILDAAEAAVLEQGFAGTSVDRIQEAAGVSRGTFFYHFPSKEALALALVERYAEADRRTTDEYVARSERLARDPLQQVLILVELFAELFESQVDGPPPGCLFASYSYESGLFDGRTHAVIRDAVVHWRDRIGAKLDEAIAAHPLRVRVTGRELADLAYSIIEGAMVLSRVLGEPRLLADHTRQFRTYLELVFGVEAAEPASVETRTPATATPGTAAD